MMSTVQTPLLDNTIKQLYRKHTRNAGAPSCREPPPGSFWTQQSSEAGEKEENRERLQCKQGSPARPQVAKQKHTQ